MMQTRPLPPQDELVNAFEFEEVAKRVLAAETFAVVSGSDRAAFDRITLRPRMCVPVLDMDLTVSLFGESHFTPILVGPVAEQRRFHRDGELATVRGAGAAKASVVVSSRSSVAIADLAREATSPMWCAVEADGNAPAHAASGVTSGCTVVCITVGPRIDWRAVEQVRDAVKTPVVVKGVMTVGEAKAAVERGMRGVVVSSHGRAVRSGPAAIEVLPSISDAVGGRAVVMIDGSFRRGSDVLKALILGANAVLVARPVTWALAAYGASGVRTLIELLQTDLARHIGALGASNLASLSRNHLKVHTR